MRACMHARVCVCMSEHVKGNRAGSLNERLRETTNGAEFSSCYDSKEMHLLVLWINVREQGGRSA